MEEYTLRLGVFGLPSAGADELLSHYVPSATPLPPSLGPDSLSGDDLAHSLNVYVRRIPLPGHFLGDLVAATLSLELWRIPTSCLAASGESLTSLLAHLDGLALVFSLDVKDSMGVVDRWRKTLHPVLGKARDPPRLLLVAVGGEGGDDDALLSSYVIEGGYYTWACVERTESGLDVNSVQDGLNQILPVMYEHGVRRVEHAVLVQQAESEREEGRRGGRRGGSTGGGGGGGGGGRSVLALPPSEPKSRRMRRKQTKVLGAAIRDFYTRLEADLEAVGALVEDQGEGMLERLQKQRSLENARLLGGLRPDASEQTLVRTQYLFSLRVSKWEALLVNMVTELSIEWSGLSTASYTAESTATILDNVSVVSSRSTTSSGGASSVFSWAPSSTGSSNGGGGGGARSSNGSDTPSLPLNLVAPEAQATFEVFSSLFTADGIPLVPGQTPDSVVSPTSGDDSKGKGTGKGKGGRSFGFLFSSGPVTA